MFNKSTITTALIAVTTTVLALRYVKQIRTFALSG